MAKRDPEMVNVGTHKFTMLDLSLTGGQKKTVAIYLNPGTGVFKIKLPDEVVAIFGCEPFVWAMTLHEVQNNFARKLELYHAETRSRVAEPMLVIHWAYNKPSKSASNVYGHRGLGSGFIGARAPDLGLALAYEVLHKIGNSLFELNIDEDKNAAFAMPSHRMSVKEKDRIIIPWTQEREAFIANMVDSMTRLIDGCNEFFGKNILENMTKAIESGMGGFMLPAPRHD